MTSINVLAQAATGGAQQPNSMIPMLMMVLVFVGMWFLIIAPQRKKLKEHDKMVNALKSGDEIVTSGGLYGTIQQVRDDRFVIKISDDVRVEVAKGFVSTRVNAPAAK
jgi:preprotein translocase subunit YajC